MSAWWVDGHTETRTLTLTATARELDQVGKRGEVLDVGTDEMDADLARAGGDDVSARGVLDLTLDVPGRGARVIRARLAGIAAEIVARLNDRPLRDLGIPIRFILGDRVERPTMITVDEAGRVRAEGDYGALASHGDDAASATNEAQAFAGTQALVDRVMAQSLATMGIKVEHDDSTGERA